MDCTTSMTPFKDEAQKNLIKIIDDIRNKCKLNAMIRIAFIGYRDFDENY